MPEPIQVSATLSGVIEKDMRFETGRLAKQANGAVMSSLGKTQVLVAVTAASEARENSDFFPLTVDVEEKMYAAGKIPGSFFRREARAGETAILTCRLIDRSIRPSFPDGFRNEVHLVATVMGADQANPYDVLSINAASAALSISDLPFSGPIGAVRLGFDCDGNWISNPTYEDAENCTFELVVAGRILDNDDVAIMMVEAASNEDAASKQEEGAAKMQEDVLAEGLENAKTHIREAVELQRQLIVAAGAKLPMEYEAQSDYSDEVFADVKSLSQSGFSKILGNPDKAARKEQAEQVKSEVKEALSEKYGEESDLLDEIGPSLKAVNKEVIRQHIAETKTRVDGRKTDELRQLSADVAQIEVAHGSALFQRGDTQVLNITTLGTQRMDQLLDGIDPAERKRFMHHYNFPPFSTGEVGFMRGPKRREIGHGALAEKAISGVIPSFSDFPYTIRLVSEVLSSDGSTSMASICSSSLSLMDAGVPIKKAVAGIAMGLIYENGDYLTLTDILGEEDAYGDMDFKVAGTDDSVTALQMDTKIEGVPSSVLAAALQQARDARMQILEVMNATLSQPRDDIGETAPRIVTFEIPTDKIGEVIGPKGKTINSIQEKSGADVNVDSDNGPAVVTLSATSRSAIELAEAEIQAILNPPEPEMGATYTGEVVNITNFGAFVNILPGTDGLLHISKLGDGKRLDKVEEVMNLGDTVTVIVDDIEKTPRGGQRVALSLPGSAPSGGGSRGGSGERNSERNNERGGGRGSERGGGGRRDRGREDRKGSQGRNRNKGGGRRDRQREPRGDTSSSKGGDGADEVSFSDTFAGEMES